MHCNDHCNSCGASSQNYCEFDYEICGLGFRHRHFEVPGQQGQWDWTHDTS